MSFSSALALAPHSTAITSSNLPEDWDLSRLANSDFDRIGQDLQITDTSGNTLFLKGYFLNDELSDLNLGNGIHFRADWVDRLCTTQDKLAQANNQNAEPIGTVETISGTVNVERADGSHVQLKQSDAVYQDDLVTTDSDSTVGIVFVDGSNFSLGGDGKMLLDEMVYDHDSGEEGSGSVSVLNGTFAFISGQIAKTAPDAMVIKTPSSTIGFRGTSASGNVLKSGETKIVLMHDPDGTVGEIIIVTDTGVSTLSQALQAANIGVGPTAAISVFVMTPEQFSQQFGTVTMALPAAEKGSIRDFLDRAIGVTSPTGEADDDTKGTNEGDNIDASDGESDGTPDMQISGGEDEITGTEGNEEGTITSEELIALVQRLIAEIISSPAPPRPTPSAPTIDDDEMDLVTDSTDDTVTPLVNSSLSSGSYVGTTANDILAFATGSSGTLYGLAGNDTLTGGVGIDTLYGGSGNDIIYGNNADDKIYDDSGMNEIYGGNGDDTITITDASAGSTIDGGNGDDKLVITNSANLTISESAGTITSSDSSLTASFTDIESFTLGGGDDLYLSSSMAMTVNSGYGNDTIVVYDDADDNEYIGSDGTDTLDFSNITGSTYFDVSASDGFATSCTGAELTFSGFEKFILTQNNDSFTAGDNGSTVCGMDGDDELNGGAGADSFAFYTDTTGSIADIFAAMGTDTINDYDSLDSILLSDTVFGVNVQTVSATDADGVSTDSGSPDAYGTGSGVAAVEIDGGNVELWYFEDLSNATTSTGYQFATLVTPTDFDVSDISTYTPAADTGDASGTLG